MAAAGVPEGENLEGIVSYPIIDMIVYPRKKNATDPR